MKSSTFCRIAIAVAGAGCRGGAGMCGAVGVVLAPETGGVRHVAGDGHVFIAEALDGGDIAAVFRRHRPQLGRPYQRLPGKNTACQQAEYDQDYT